MKHGLSLTSPGLVALVVTVFLALAVLLAPPVAGQRPDSAWQSMVRGDPGLAEDTTIGPLEQRILEMLTPSQAEDWLAGEDPAGIMLTDGSSLADLVTRALSTSTGLVFYSLPTCTLVNTRKVGGPQSAGSVRHFAVAPEGADLSGAGGSPTGCGIPSHAEAIALGVKVFDQTGRGRLDVYAYAENRRGGGIIDFHSEGVVRRNTMFVKVASSQVSVEVRSSGVASTGYKLRVWGYFAPPEVGKALVFHDDFDPPLSPIWKIERADVWVDNGWLHTLGGAVGPHRGAFAFLGEGKPWTDYRFSTRFYAEGGGNNWYNAIIYFRVKEWVPETQSGDFYALHLFSPLWPGGANVQLHRVADNVGSVIFEAAPPSGGLNDQDNTVTVEVLGGRIRVNANGYKLIDIVDPDPVLFGGVGLASIWESHTRFDFAHLEH